MEEKTAEVKQKGGVKEVENVGEGDRRQEGEEKVRGMKQREALIAILNGERDQIVIDFI